MWSTGRALVRSAHPGPTLVVTAIASVLALGAGYRPGRLLLIALVVFCGQLSIGWSNDWIDADRDLAAGRPDKPVAAGAVRRGTVRGLAYAAATATVVLSLPLGPGAILANAVAVGMGWLYNARLKSTVLSPLPYIVCFGLIPLLVTLGLPAPRLAHPWVVAAGALLGVAAHFTNVLPDLRDDRRTGVRGLPHILGALPSGAMAFGLLLVVAGLVVAGTGATPPVVVWPGAAVTVCLAAAGVVELVRGARTRLLMRLIMGAALANVVMLAFAGTGVAI